MESSNMRGRAQSSCSGSSRSSASTGSASSGTQEARHFIFDRDWYPDVPLVIQANQLIIGRLGLGHTLPELVAESARNEAGCHPGTMAAYFHHAITLELACLMSNDTVQMAIVKGVRV
ncbi:hypothetical protein HER10_EVM0004499 [Colletotrichum scovillei]|uniref:Uncharacterized protein n=2 Tax=Colletotrichum acutatum species complex TaxID=2707335 RepID=A0A9P7R631_9PEZI|nr:uncharacterized protein HER10_EVM0004499 [Colletotrichum scovillei]KAI3555671.1 hypothetical protein CABS02_04047 [Colletotrichum abscissum]KAK1709482.1 hypothetical protein BDP67DRAFT_115055 [Colletotrichum lupini]KAF4781874.1 hypothetical protein HER10_EVM0004499 [Colletotrichum scovillei]KAG7050062.1 hypothetical protein JMJ77_0012818 [Colletotrichum scovillei]KAG7069101.1 hypothetical protein JMJ76_0002778 [Colletotrichum scovillei]